MRPLALKWRLSILMAAAMAVAVAGFGLITYHEVSQLIRGERDSGQPALTTIIALTPDGREAELAELVWDLVYIGAVVTGAMALVVVLLARTGLKPIGAAARRLAGIDARSLGQADLRPQDSPAELRPFILSLNQMLARLDEAMRREKAFVADASHELRTPLAVAKSTIQASLASERTARESRRSLEETQEDLRRLEHLVDELLLLARLEGTAADQPMPDVRLDEVLADLSESFGPRATQAGGRLLCSPAPILVRGDRDQLHRLFSNLLDNALRYGPRGGTVECTVQAQGRQAVVQVKDEGGGIPPEAIPRLFERFFRVDGSRSASTGGAGLGLAIAREIVLRHGGTIGVASDPSAGTRVTVTLPLARSERFPG